MTWLRRVSLAAKAWVRAATAASCVLRASVKAKVLMACTIGSSSVVTGTGAISGVSAVIFSLACASASRGAKSVWASNRDNTSATVKNSVTASSIDTRSGELPSVVDQSAANSLGVSAPNNTAPASASVS